MDKERELTLAMINRVMELVEAISWQLQKELQGVKINSLELTVGMLHKRMHSNLIMIRSFVADEKNLSATSPTILFRTIALDYMTLVYLDIRRKEFEGKEYKWKNPVSEKMQAELDVLLNDQLVKLYKDAYSLIGVEFENEKKYNEWINDIRKLLPSEYHAIDKDTKGYRFLSPTELFQFLKKNLPDDEFNTNVKKIWDFYSTYSKTDHFGIMSIVLDKMPLEIFIRQLRLALLFVVDELSITGVGFMQVQTFWDMWLQLAKDLKQFE